MSPRAANSHKRLYISHARRDETRRARSNKLSFQLSFAAISTARRTNHILILIYTRADCGDAQAHFKAELFRDWGFAAARARAEALKTVASRR